ncbi:MAG: DUF4197 domain-containing protein, partial [Verrucomicrobiae bacterium]|nr:DUF4197 domain-containing protein [Verrucomicrobiae bacterium]
MTRTSHIVRGLILLSILAPATTWGAGLLDWLKGKQSGSQPATAGQPASIASLSEAEVAKALKEALSQGVKNAVATLGKDGGFLNNAKVKIPMPDTLKQVEKGLRALKQEKLADEFVATMNHAAEKAVPEAASVFANALTKMTVQDAKNILSGQSDAATQFFRRTSEGELKERFLPIVKTCTEKVGVTAAYKKLTAHAGFMSSFISKDALDIDG